MPQNLRLFHPGVSGMKNMFDKKVEEHKQAQLDNPFSEWEGAGRTRRLSKEDIGYGRPLPGSQSEKRSQAAQQHIMMEIRYLCDMIWDCSEWRSPDGRAAITFGKLFKLYIGISDKVVGTLLRARKHGFLHFEGEMLYQRRDESKVIELTRPYNTIRARFGQKPVLTGGGEVEPWADGDDAPLVDSIPRRNSLPAAASRKLSLCPLPNPRRSSLPYTSLSLNCSPERAVFRDDARAKSEDRDGASLDAGVVVVSACDDDASNAEEPQESAERDAHLLDPEVLRGRPRRPRSRSPSPGLMDTILEDAAPAPDPKPQASLSEPQDGEEGRPQPADDDTAPA
nr:uncharacterized protein LOC113803737 [Penaeus vannamei]